MSWESRVFSWGDRNMTLSPLVFVVLAGGYRRLPRREKIKLFIMYTTRSGERKQTGYCPPTYSYNCIENSTSQEPHLCTGMYHPVWWLSGQSFQLFTFCSFHLHLCSSVWLTVPEDSLNTNPAWQPLEALVLFYCGVAIYYGLEFCYSKDNQ